jgi:hypothetical protein
VNVGTVENGTHAGWRRVRAKRDPWLCGCFERDPADQGNAVKKKQFPNVTKCHECGETKPK